MLGTFPGRFSSLFNVDDDENDGTVTPLPTLLGSSWSMAVKSSKGQLSSALPPQVPAFQPSNSVSTVRSDNDEEDSSSLLDVVLRLFAPTGCSPHFCDKDKDQYELLMTSRGGNGQLHSLNTARRNKRVLIIGPGFGLERNPRQSDMVNEAGFQVKWVCNVPNPEEFGFCMMSHLPIISGAISDFSPHLVVAASKGGHYLMALWDSGLWAGPSLMMNAHPSLKRLPTDVPIVLAVGCNDELYPRSRDDLDALMSTGTPGMCFLYFTDNGGSIQGRHTRFGDKHDMDSLLICDCLPRLMDAAMSSLGPETHLIRSWRERMTTERLAAERWLGYNPDRLREKWVSDDQQGFDDEILFEVCRSTEEFNMIETLFHAEPREASAYGGPNPAWAATSISRIQRVENGLQMNAGVNPFYETLQLCIEDQDIDFEPGVHTRWAFHGTDAIDSIINNPMSGFQPLTSGARTSLIWGSGSYFARDAKYVIDGGYAQPDANGVRQILLCLVLVGVSCLGDPRHKGVLPMRLQPHRYNSSVDSLSNPEVFVVQHPSAAYPAYLITLAS